MWPGVAGGHAHGSFGSMNGMDGMDGMDGHMASVTMRDKLGAMSFRYSLRDPEQQPEEPGGADFAFWGQADLRPLGGSHEYAGAGGSVSWDGDVLGLIVGVDGHLGADLLAGVAVSRFDSMFEYALQEGEERFEGLYRTTMTGLHPYAHWAATPGREFWATAGYGAGDVLFDTETFGIQAADSAWQTGAVGGKLHLASDRDWIPHGVTTLDLRADAFATRLSVRQNGELVRALDISAHRLRLALVGQYERTMPSGAAFIPSLEVGGRSDGGDGETGAGMEIGSRLRFVSPGGRVSIDLRVHTLAKFSGEKNESGIGGSIQLAPGPHGRGFSLNLRPSYGPMAGGAEGMWHQAPVGEAFAQTVGTQMDGELGCGFGVLHGRGVLTIHSGFSWQEAGAQRNSLGATLAYGTLNLRFDLERMAAADRPEHGVLLQLEKVLGGGHDAGGWRGH